MRIVSSSLLSGLVAACFFAPAAWAADLSLNVVGVDANSGQLMIALYDNPEAYAGGEPTRSVRVPARGATVAVQFEGLAAGRYAIRMFHDVNGNGELDKNLFGIPTEPVGFSNRARANLGPPGFAAASFDLSATGGAQTIDLERF